jgi:ribonuclease E
MDEPRNIEAVERRLKDAMRHDRARVQVGRISPFGLLELSRQRLRPNIIESTSIPCHACRGTGMVRSVESSSLHVLRAIEEEAIQQKISEIVVYVPSSTILYMLNQKRKTIQDIENRWKITIRFSKDDSLIPPDYRIERIRLRREPAVEEVKVPLSEAEEVSSIEPSHQPKEAQRHTRGREQGGKKRRFDRQGHPHRAKVQAVSPAGDVVVEGEILVDEKSLAHVSSEGSTQPTPPEGGGARPRPHKRYRKYGRKPHREKEQGASSEGRPRPEASPSFPSSSRGESTELPPREVANTEKGKPASTEEKSTPPQRERKKASTRKGWWQRLLE